MTDGWVETVETIETIGWVDDLAQAARRHGVAVSLTFTPLDPEPDQEATT